MKHDNDNKLPRSFSEARTIGSTHYFTGKHCKHGHISLRYTCDKSCAECKNTMGAAWRRANKEKAAEIDARSRRKNLQGFKDRVNRYYAKNAESLRAKKKERRLANIETSRAREREYARKKLSTPKGKLENAIKNGIYRGITRGSKHGRHTFELLGYSLNRLMRHLEKRFQPGMTWENYGDEGWHVDHIIPLAAHNYETPDDEDFKRAWSLKNLQPLWGPDNISKSDRLEKEFQPSLALH